MRSLALRWELIGIAIISVAGSILHFVFAWSNYWPPIGAIAAVNESVWEHFKIAFWPALFYAVVEYAYLKRSVSNFLSAKAIGIYAMPITIAALFYAYTTITGREILVVDISIFVVAVAVGQIVSYKLLTYRQLPRWSNTLGLIFLICLALAFILFTYYPPHFHIFQDAITGRYGIP